MVSGLSLCCVTVTCNHGTADCAMFFVCGPDAHIILFEAVISEEGYLIFIDLWQVERAKAFLMLRKLLMDHSSNLMMSVYITAFIDIRERSIIC